MDKILVVDDDSSVRKLLKDTLSAAGYDVIGAGYAGEALEVMGLEKPELMITDLGLPDMDGIALCREARGVGHDFPILILTGAPQADTTVEALELGIHDYLWKPYRREELLLAVERGLAVRRLRRVLFALYMDAEGFGAAGELLESLLLRGLDGPGSPVQVDWREACRRLMEAAASCAGTAGETRRKRVAEAVRETRRLETIRSAERGLAVEFPPVAVS